MRCYAVRTLLDDAAVRKATLLGLNIRRRCCVTPAVLRGYCDLSRLAAAHCNFQVEGVGCMHLGHCCCCCCCLVRPPYNPRLP
jgi:hypothetical protein